MLARRVGHNVIWTFAGEFCSRGSTIFLSIYLARVLGAQEFGVFATIQAIVYYLWTAVDLGTGLYGIREVSRTKENPSEIVEDILSLRIAASLIVFVILSVVAILLPNLVRDPILLIACGTYLMTYAIYPDWAFKGLERFKDIAFGNFIIGLLIVSGLLIFVQDSSDGALGGAVWAGSYLIGSVYLLMTLYRRLRDRPRLSLQVKRWLSHLRQSVYFTLTAALNMMFQLIPIFALGYYASSYHVGIFAAPFKIITTLSSVGYFAAISFYPILSEKFMNEASAFDSTVKKMRIFLLLAGLSVGTFGFVVSEALILAAFDEDYGESIPIFQILLCLVPLHYLRFSYGIPLSASNKQKSTSWIVALGVCMLVMIGLPLTYFYSLKGISFSLVFSEVLIVFLMARKLREK